MSHEMTYRERYRRTLLFEEPDSIAFIPGEGRESTRKTWIEQGLPENVEDIAEYAYREVGGKQEWPRAGDCFLVNERMIPEFEEKVIEEKENSRIVQDWKGNICEISKEFNVEHLRSPIDFVTRRWIKCPVESRADWEDMKKRYDPDSPERFPPKPEEAAAQWAASTNPTGVHFSGPFWQLREWLGLENLCMLLHDDLDFVLEMIKFWEDYIARLMRKAFKYIIPDEILVSEDMAYKSFSMISPTMTREFLFPTWKQWGDIVKESGVPIYSMDSDGYIGELIPIWIEAGFNMCEPMEVAAGNDLPAYRRTYGRDMAFIGGVDKRAIAKGGKVLEAEICRLRPVIESGGYIPSCDHGIPADVSWPNYLLYIELLAKETGWL